MKTWMMLIGSRVMKIFSYSSLWLVASRNKYHNKPFAVSRIFGGLTIWWLRLSTRTDFAFLERLGTRPEHAEETPA